MVVYTWDNYKGYHIHHDNDFQSQLPTKEATTPINGLNSLPWSKHLVLPEKTSNTTPTQLQTNSTSKTKSKKLSKSEKREIKQVKKINAQKRRQSERNNLIESSSNGVDVVADQSPYMTKQELKSTYNRIVLHQKKHLESTFNKKISISEDFKILKYNAISIYKSDFQTLLPNEWINDNIISLILELIKETFFKPTIAPSTNQIQLLFPSIVQLIQHFPSADVENLLPVAELKKSKFVFLPINLIDDDEINSQNIESENNGDHWILGILSLIDYKLFIYDSMVLEDDTKSDLQLLKICKKLESCTTLIPQGKKLKLIQMKCDQQNNFDDCGVFVIMIICYLINELLFGDDSQADDESAKRKVSLNIESIKFNSLSCRLAIMKLISKLMEY
ncbi:uncharacterized protein KGF55_001432 [Candida pseudojiufengensis]|uniref:uncharacterized protein n=1 Tax=Candida pseudojiufengensis TaxID=497109 RepID=UPI00222553F2|nr:uncharacterized protein KGF55_001432 [Candida pseudojiufengensis]KAI5965212.1 hypothetical protein KGF55_001432 [Candida pseudojiufengensis]